jgi:translation elongation factor EF-Ts
MDPRRHESKSISQALVDTVGRLGEKIEIRRGVLGYEGQMGSQKMVSVVHGVIPVARDGQGQENVMVKCGQIGALVALGRIGGDISSLQSSGINSGNGTESLSSTSASIEAEERELAQHIIGMQPANVEQLLEQPFLFSKAEQQQTVGQYLTEKQLLVRDFVRFNCGESLMTAEDESGDENEKQVAHA